MSYSQDVKKELCQISIEDDCCKRAEAYGLLYFGRSFDKNDISLMTESDYIADRYCSAAEHLIGSMPNKTKSKSGKITLEFSSPEQRMDILNELGYSGNERTYRLLTSNIENTCCFGAFLRGTFLSSGIVTDPNAEYHLEFDVSFKTKSRDLCETIEYFKEVCNEEDGASDDFEPLTFVPKQSDRNGRNIVYFKDSSQIEELLALMGAQLSALELINLKILKDVRNKVNRKVNCDNANIKKTFEAATKQISAIKKLKKSGVFDTLSAQMQEIANIRLENPEMTLTELGNSLSEPISRSGVNHRLNKLISLADKLN